MTGWDLIEGFLVELVTGCAAAFAGIYVLLRLIRVFTRPIEGSSVL